MQNNNIVVTNRYTLTQCSHTNITNKQDAESKASNIRRIKSDHESCMSTIEISWVIRFAFFVAQCFKDPQLFLTSMLSIIVLMKYNRVLVERMHVGV